MCEHGCGFVHFIDKRAKVVIELHPSFKGSDFSVFEKSENEKRSLFFEFLVYGETPFSSSRSANRPHRIRAFTVPKGAPSLSAI